MCSSSIGSNNMNNTYLVCVSITTYLRLHFTIRFCPSLPDVKKTERMHMSKAIWLQNLSSQHSPKQFPNSGLVKTNLVSISIVWALIKTISKIQTCLMRSKFTVFIFQNQSGFKIHCLSTWQHNIQTSQWGNINIVLILIVRAIVKKI